MHIVSASAMCTHMCVKPHTRTSAPEVGVRVTDDAEQSYSEDGRALMLLCLCPGFFGCSAPTYARAHTRTCIHVDM